MQTAHLRLKVPPMELAQATSPRQILGFNRRWFISPRALLNGSIQRGRFGISFFLGVYRRCDLLLPNGHRLREILKLTIVPNPLFFFTFHKLSFPASSRELFVHWSDPGVPESQRPPAPFEVEIRDHQRAQHLATSYLVRIEDREDGGSRLMKDKADGRLWQWMRLPGGQEALFLVNVNQWSYRFIEMRELKNARRQGNELDEQELRSYFETLQDDPQGGGCQEAGCPRPKARFSNLCREHHFQTIMGRSWPLEDQAKR